MIISFVGMSGSGKTYWSKKLELLGFERFGCDDLIEKKLGYSGIQDVAKWMGQPFDPKYKSTSKKYLNFEKEVLKKILRHIEKNSAEEKNIVIDTTGSVIYTGEEILKKLSQLTNVIYLEVSDKVLEDMYELYLKDPKPVIWGNSFRKKSGETNMDTLKRCYPKLLKLRSKTYAEIAKVKIDCFKLRNGNFSGTDFIKLIKNHDLL